MKKFINWITGPKSDFVLLIILLVLINLVGANSFFRLDLTSPKSYSLSQSSKEVVKNLEEPLSVKVFFSNNLPSPYNTVEQYLEDILVEYKGSANKNFSYEFFDMDKPENEELASSYRIRQKQIQEVKDNEVGFKNVYMG
ncbi:MAG: GldG family protein, partial [Spirochaetaceae bacterium]|nr:GldG family protein [Spirochaetaceae bacterium]